MIIIIKNQEEIEKIDKNVFKKELMLRDKIKEICRKVRGADSTPRKLENLRDVVEIDQKLKKTENDIFSFSRNLKL